MLRKSFLSCARQSGKRVSVVATRNYAGYSGDTPSFTASDAVPFEQNSHVSGIVATVFGATGFVGRYVIQRIGEQGSQVVIPYRGTENVFRHLKVLGDLGQVVPMACDVWKPEHIEECCSQSNLVINLIGSRWPTKNFSMDDTNHIIAGNIAKGAKKAGVSRMIHVSALGASEDGPSEFAKSKWLGEVAVREAFPDATILRPSTLFGYEDHLLNRWAGILKYWPVVPILEETMERKEAPLAATDLAESIKKCMFDLSTSGKVFELEGPSTLTTREMINLVRDTTYLETREMKFPTKAFTKFVGISANLFRVPRFTKDEIIFGTTDNLATPDTPGIADLGIKPIKLETIAVKYIRHFRKAKFINEL